MARGGLETGTYLPSTENVRLRCPASWAHLLLSPRTMFSFKLQTILGQLSGLTPAELSEVKAAVNERLSHHLRTLSADGDLTAEEWAKLEGSNLRDCVMLVRERTGLGLVDSKAYVDRARAKGRPRAQTVFPHDDDAHDSAAGPQRDSEGHTLYCPRGCCDTTTWQDPGNGGRWEGHK